MKNAKIKRGSYVPFISKVFSLKHHFFFPFSRLWQHNVHSKAVHRRGSEQILIHKLVAIMGGRGAEVTSLIRGRREHVNVVPSVFPAEEG